MDPLTAFSLAASVVTFIDFSTKLVKGAIKIHELHDGDLDENRSRESLARDLNRMAAQLLPPDSSSLAGEDKSLCLLATECRDLSAKLVELLERIKPKDSKSKSQSLWSALKNKVNEQDRADLELRLDYCRSQLTLHMACLNQVSLQTLIDSTKNDASKAERLRRNVEHLVQGVQVAGMTPEAQAQIRRLVTLQEDAFSAVIQNRIVNSLAFEGMYGRCDMVAEAHDKTFRWILGDEDGNSVDDDAKGGDDGGDDNDKHQNVEWATYEREKRAKQAKMRCEAKDKFTSWLSSGDGVFHICGKLGSGKSTLMKYLGDHPTTRAELTKWADGRDLVPAQFFFWKPGTPKQKSLDGLYRSLLHGVFKARPELIPEAMPELWKDARAMPWQAQTDLLIHEKGIRRAFDCLIRIASRDDHKNCFCFFIDGLDEYEETAQNDRKEMVRLLNSWAKAAPRQVKLCVSSREDNVFMNAFAADKRLRLHELTRFDMETYCRGMLDGISDQKAKEELIAAITDKAQGIFQWVALVVKQMRDELENGAQRTALLKLVDSYPDELDSLYEHILNSLRRPDRRKAYQTLAMLRLRLRMPISSFAYSFFDKLDTDTTFAERDDFVENGWGGMTAEQRIELGGKRVNGWCRGLVDPGENSLDFAHRSIPEFLENEIVKAEMESVLAGFNPGEALSQLVLAELRLTGDLNSQESGMFGFFLQMRHYHGLDHAPFRFLGLLEAAASQNVEEGSKTSSILAVVRHGFVNDEQTGFDAIRITPRVELPDRFIASALFYCTVQFADHEYPVWKITNDPSATDSAAKVAHIAYALFMRQPLGKEVNLSVLDALFDRGLLRTRTRMRVPMVLPGVSWFLWGKWTDSDEGSMPVSSAVPQHGEIEISMWQHYLMNQWLIQQTPWQRILKERPFGPSTTQFGVVVERFLRRGVVGAEKRFTVWVPRLDQTKVYFALGGDPAGVGGVTTESLVDACWVELPEDGVRVDEFDKKVAGCPPTGWETELVYLCSLRSWIEGLDSAQVPNRDEILRLLDRKEPSPAEPALEDDLPLGDDLSPGGNPAPGFNAPGLRVLRDLVKRIGVGYAIVVTLVPLLAFCLSVLPVGITAIGMPFGNLQSV